jgi:hypothetical protein
MEGRRWTIYSHYPPSEASILYFPSSIFHSLSLMFPITIRLARSRHGADENLVKKIDWRGSPAFEQAGVAGVSRFDE